MVFGDPVCGNGLLEANESCDCGGVGQCADPCCNATTCAFSQPHYECSDSVGGGCCENCMIVKSSRMCRAHKNECDLPEYCTGTSPKCPADEFYYPGKPCKTHGFHGICSTGMCHSNEATCATTATSVKAGFYDLNEKCASYNDECGVMVCHDANSTDPYDCHPNFVLHNQLMQVPEGNPCWFPGDPDGVRNGVCQLGKCKLPHALAEVPLCGNGGIDYGEECDCGGLSSAPKCCDCNTCKLKSGAQCSELEPCCDSATCTFRTAGTVCRPAVGDCDVAETCSGTSGVCPSDFGARWGTPCNGTSTCYGKVCLDSLDKQCEDLTCHAASSSSCKRYHYRTGGGSKMDSFWKTDGVVNDADACQALSCCTSCPKSGGGYYCSGCGASMSRASYSFNGVTTSIVYKNAAKDGSVVANPNKICDGQPNSTAIIPNENCTAGTYYQPAVGLCVPCDEACNNCTGPDVFDCIGACRHGPSDSRGACPISAEQVKFANRTRVHYMPIGPGGNTTPAITPGPGVTTPSTTTGPGGTTPTTTTGPGGTTSTTTTGPGGTTPAVPDGGRCIKIPNAKVARILEISKGKGLNFEIIRPSPETCR